MIKKSDILYGLISLVIVAIPFILVGGLVYMITTSKKVI